MDDDLKFELCCGARLLHHAGLSEGIGGHLSIKLDHQTMIATRFGVSLATALPEDILTLDFDGTIREGRGRVIDTILLHGVIHQSHPDVVAVVHAHPPAVVTFSTLRTLPEVYDQAGCFVVGDIAIVEEEYSGLAKREERVRPMADALGQYAAVILPNHGAITRGENMRMAVLRMLSLEWMVRRHLAVAAAARATGITPRPIAPEVALMAKQEMIGQDGVDLVWEDMVAQLRKSDPELFVSR